MTHLFDDRREAGAALACLERALELAPAEYPELPRLLADLAARATPERARTVLLQAAEVLRRRAEGIEDGEAKRRFLRENALHRRILERAAEAGSLPSS